MALKAKLTKDEFGKLSAEAVAAMKAAGVEYVETDGSMLLKVDPVDNFGLENAEELRTIVEKERGISRKAQAALAAFDGLDAKAAKAALAKLKEFETSPPDDKHRSQLASALKDNDEKWTGEVSKLGELNTKLKGQLVRTLIDAAAIQAIAEHKGSTRGLLPHVKSAVRVVEEGGEYVARVFNPDGNVRMSRKKGTDPMPISEYVEGMKADADLAPLFAGSGVAGSGAQTRGASTGGQYTLSAQEAKSNPRAWEQVRDRAQAAGVEAQMIP